MVSTRISDAPVVEVRRIVLEAIREMATLEGVDFEVSLDTPLFGERKDAGLAFDSLTALELMSVLEERLDVLLEDPGKVFGDVRCGHDIVRLVSGR